ncbi:MAG: hypothetical protein KGL39_58380 [Patescibacteria group bacterium]|nr:hypothetical protein [Patescibacteria group bacterium]
MEIKKVQVGTRWHFYMAHMDCHVRGWSFDEKGADNAIERSRKFLLDMATHGLQVVEGGEAPPEERL